MEKYTFKQTEKKSNKYSYEVKVDPELYNTHRDIAFKKLAPNVKISGFRPGKAPKESIQKELGNDLLVETINSLLPSVAIEILENEKLNPISSLDYDVKEFGKEGEMTFTFSFYNQPEVDIEKFKKISIKPESSKVEDSEVDVVIRNMVRNTIPGEKLANILGLKKDASKEEHVHEHTEGEEHNHEHDDNEIEIPEEFNVTDDMVKELGYEDETTLQGMKVKVKETLEQVKKQQSEQDFAGKVIDEAIKLAEFEVPTDFIDREVGQKEEVFNSRLARLKLDRNAYLKTQNTTMDKLREDWTKEAKKDITADLLLINLATKEKLIPTDEEVEAEIEKIEDPRVKAQYKVQKNKDYMRTLMARDKGLQRLVEVVKKD